MIRVIVSLALLLSGMPAQAATLFTDFFDSYGSNVALPSPPYYGNSTLSAPPFNINADTTHFVSAPAAAGCNRFGNGNNAFRDVGATVTGMKFTYKLYVDSTVNVAGCTIASGNVAGFNAPKVIFLNNGPGTGSTNVQLYDCNTVSLGTVTMSGAGFHSIVMQFSCAGTVCDYVSLSIDGVNQYVGKGVSHAQSLTQFVYFSTGIGASPPAVGWLDNLVVEDNPAPPAPGCSFGGPHGSHVE